MTATVFDTNVLVSGLLSPNGPPGRLLDAILDGFCLPVVTDSILAEYENVLCRPKFKFPANKIQLLLDAIRGCAMYAPFAPLHGTSALPDPDDVIFLEAAASLNVPLVTGNLKHFPIKAVGRVKILSPANLLILLYG